MITIKEIAEQAGVSATTVSNVLHGKVNKVSPQMVEKIQGLLQDNNYIPRFGLSALTSKESRIIGILISTPDFLETPYEKPFYGVVISTLEHQLREHGYYIMFFSSKDIHEIMRMTLGWNVDGVIAVSMPKKYCQKIGEMTGKPVVSIDVDVNHPKDAMDCYNVTSPDYEAGGDMIRYLAENKINEVVYFANIKRGSDYRRYKGANAAYKKYFGRDKTLQMTILGRSLEERNEQYGALKKLAGKNAAVFFSTDLNAAEAIGYFTRAGIRVPDEISVVGVDDEIYARLCVPGLTTIHSDVAEKARLAVKMLLRIISGKEVVTKNVEIEVQIIERESVNLNAEKG